MSICIKDLYDYNLVKKCSKCGKISLKSNFHRTKNMNDGFQPYCKLCTKKYRKKFYINHRDLEVEGNKKYRSDNKDKINEYIKNKKKLDSNYKLACNLRSRTTTAFKSQNVRKTNKTFDLLGCSHSFFKDWIIHQLYGNMTIENFGSLWHLDHCLPIASFNIMDEIDMKTCFNWVNLRPMYSSENISKKANINYRLYLLQQIKANYFSKLNV